METHCSCRDLRVFPPPSWANPAPAAIPQRTYWFRRRTGAATTAEVDRKAALPAPLLPSPRIPALQFGQLARRHNRLDPVAHVQRAEDRGEVDRSEEHTSELQSLMRISYAVFCLKKKTQKQTN